MPNHNQQLLNHYVSILRDIDRNEINLPGLVTGAHVECMARQIIDSVRRIEFVYHIRDANLAQVRKDPSSSSFDPLKAAVLQLRAGEIDEAYWLVFLATHFGKHSSDGWNLARMVYGKLGAHPGWDWATVSANPSALVGWLSQNENILSASRFSNHRKYESLKANSANGTAAVLKSYIDWVAQHGGHANMVRHIHQSVGQNPIDVFDFLYRSMSCVKRFGRLGRFDFLTMLGKLGIAPIAPGSAYLWHNATGPRNGACLLFGGATNAALKVRDLDQMLVLIDAKLDIGMQALEDSLCNWQKSPIDYKYFRG